MVRWHICGLCLIMFFIKVFYLYFFFFGSFDIGFSRLGTRWTSCGPWKRKGKGCSFPFPACETLIRAV